MCVIHIKKPIAGAQKSKRQVLFYVGAALQNVTQHTHIQLTT